jgi:hypothetical protein
MLINNHTILNNNLSATNPLYGTSRQQAVLELRSTILVFELGKNNFTFLNV